jgi:pectin methylesterase-like acyl-CoA thioesterase
MSTSITHAALRPVAALRACLILLLLLASSARLLAYDATVAQDGSGNFTTIQAAVAAAPASRTAAYTIYIKDGIYSEKVTVPSNKPFLQFVGQSVANTILTWHDDNTTPNGQGGTLGTGGSGSIVVNATDFSALNMTFVNSYGDGSQAVAVSLYADRAAFKNCRFLGNQDTLLTYESGGAVSRHYFRDCYIDGNVDFIFGNAIAIFDNCTIYAKTRVVNAATSYITAANTPPTQAYGYLFRKARIPSNNGTTLYYLGRPWQNSTGFSEAAGTLAHNKVVFSQAKIGVNEIQPAGWAVWDAGTDVTKITNAEFRPTYFDGHAVNTAPRVSWSKQLAPADTLDYSLAKMFGPGTGTASASGAPVAAAWNPTALGAEFGTYRAPDIAVANLRATKGASQTTIQWNISWAIAGIKYDLQRSVDNAAFVTINSQTAATDSLVNFLATDALPAAGTRYYYRVVAAKTNLATHTTPSILVSSIPTITTSSRSLAAFTQYNAGTSAVQTYTVAGVNLTAGLVITPPAGFELSTNGGTTWSGSAAPITLVPTNNTLASTTVSVRLNTATPGAVSGTITHASPGATPISMAVSGNRLATAAPQSDPLIWWPLTRNGQDSTAIRSPRLTAAAPTRKALYLANGTTLPTTPAYSTKFGQALGASSNGDGTWTAVGGTLKRNYYEQFTVTATAAGAVRLDSLLLSAAFYNTSSNTKLAVVYSKSAFVADSSDVSAGVGPGLTSTAYGAFGAPIVLPNQPDGPTNVYRLVLNGSTGLTLAAGQTLTLRLYWACGSTGTPRYALLKNVVVKGAAQVITATANASAQAADMQLYPNPTPDGRLTLALRNYREPAQLTVCNALGQRVASATVPAGAASQLLDLSGLAPGLYTVQARTASGAPLVRRLVRQ